MAGSLRSGAGSPEYRDLGENRASPGAGAGAASWEREHEPGDRRANKPTSPKRISRGAGRAEESLRSEIGLSSKELRNKASQEVNAGIRFRESLKQNGGASSPPRDI